MTDVNDTRSQVTAASLTPVDPYAVPRMPDFFVRTACGWISPGTIADSAREIRTGSGASAGTTDWWFQAVEPVQLGIPVLDVLVREFLARFHLPEDMIQLSRAFYPDAFDDATIAHLRTLQFTGEVLDPELEDDVPSSGALIGLRAEWKFIRLVLRPISVIVEKVVEIALGFHSGIQGNKVKDFLTFEHHQPEAFATHIELAVAHSLFGPMLTPHAWRANRLMRLAFPAFNVVSPPPVDPDFLEKARQRARALAQQEFKTLGSPELP